MPTAIDKRKDVASSIATAVKGKKR